MKVIFSHRFMQGNEGSGFNSLTPTGQEQMIANVQEITSLVAPIGCTAHPYALVPVITASIGGEMHNTFFVCCSDCKEILTRALSYGRAHFRVICLPPKDARQIIPR